jgi:hypothetical protein
MQYMSTGYTCTRVFVHSQIYYTVTIQHKHIEHNMQTLTYNYYTLTKKNKS